MSFSKLYLAFIILPTISIAAPPYKSGVLIYQSDNNSNKSGEWTQVTTLLNIDSNGNCEKVIEKTGEDAKGNSKDETKKIPLKKKECAALFLAQDLRKEFLNCRYNLPSSDESLTLDEECLCYHKTEEFSGFFSALLGRVSGSEKHRSADWAKCLNMFPEDKRETAQKIAEKSDK